MSTYSVCFLWRNQEKYQYFSVKMLLIWSFILNAYMRWRTTDTQGQTHELNESRNTFIDYPETDCMKLIILVCLSVIHTVI